MYQAIHNVNGLSKGLLSLGEKDQMLVRGLEAGQSPITAAAVMNPPGLPGRLPTAGWTLAMSAGEFGFPGPGARYKI